jgi:hypothetical protein
MQADDGNLYVVKFQGNPQGTSILANEMLAAKLAANLGLPVPTTVVVDLSPGLSEELYFETPGGRQPILPGRHLGSRLVLSSLEGRSYDSLPQRYWQFVRNPEDFVGVQLFDLWTCNCNTRQFVFWKYSQDKEYTVTFIDNGHCFGGPEWSFTPLMLPNCTLAKPSTAEAWQRWADRIATFPIRRSESFEADQIPPEWFGRDKQYSVIFEELRVRQAVIAADIRRRANSSGVIESDTYERDMSFFGAAHVCNQSFGPPAQ